jgi:hypothetical protein
VVEDCCIGGRREPEGCQAKARGDHDEFLGGNDAVGLCVDFDPPVVTRAGIPHPHRAVHTAGDDYPAAVHCLRRTPTAAATATSSPGVASGQGLGKVPECLVHGLVMPSRGRMRVVWRA